MKHSRDHFQYILNELRQQNGNELVDEFCRIFLTRIPTDINDLIEARGTHDFQAIRKKAHFLTTTLLTLKFTHGLMLASELTEHIEEGRETSALMICDQLIDYLNSALNELA